MKDGALKYAQEVDQWSEVDVQNVCISADWLADVVQMLPQDCHVDQIQTAQPFFTGNVTNLP